MFFLPSCPLRLCPALVLSFLFLLPILWLCCYLLWTFSFSGLCHSSFCVPLALCFLALWLLDPATRFLYTALPCVDMDECVMKSMAGRDHVGAFSVHWTCCVCRKVLVSSYMSKYIVISQIITNIICIHLYFIYPIHIYLTCHFIYQNACFNLHYVLLLWCTVLWILIALFIWCNCQQWRNEEMQSINIIMKFF